MTRFHRLVRQSRSFGGARHVFVLLVVLVFAKVEILVPIDVVGGETATFVVVLLFAVFAHQRFVHASSS